MSELRLSLDDWQRVRFALSPAWETALAVRALTDPAARPVHGRWIDEVQGPLSAADVDMTLLGTLVPPSGWIADFLTPIPQLPSPSFAQELDRIASTLPETVVADLSMMVKNNTGDPRALEALLQNPVDTLDRAVHALQGLWECAIERFWGRLLGLLSGDIDYRLRLLSDDGASTMIDTLHPWVDLDGGVLRVQRLMCDSVDVDPGAGLLLVPCAFAWPRVYTLHAPPHQRMLSYSPRGIGNLWTEPRDVGAGPLARLVGATRASVLDLLDLPMTTRQLACHFDLSPGTMSDHLKVLHGNGLVERHARGRWVFYSRSDLGSGLLAGQGQDRRVAETPSDPVEISVVSKTASLRAV